MDKITKLKSKIILECSLLLVLILTVGFWIYTDKSPTDISIFLKLYAIVFVGVAIWDIKYKIHEIKMCRVISILILLSLFLPTAAAQPINFSIFTETDPAGHYTITANQISVLNEVGSSSKVNITLPSFWDFNVSFEVYVTKADFDGGWHVVFADGYTNPSWNTWGAVNAIGMAQINAGTYSYLIPEKYVGGTRTAGTAINLIFNTKYYITLTRSSTTLTLNVYSDANRRTHVSGSPQSLTVTSSSFSGFGLFNDIGYANLRSYNIYNLSVTNSSTPVITTPTASSISYDAEFTNFNWTISNNATNYDYQVANDTLFTDLMYDASVTMNYSNFTIPKTQQLFFRVRANGTYGHTPWSEVVTIRDLTLTSPTSGSTVYSNFPPMTSPFTFTWTATNTTAVDFNLRVASDIDFNVIESDTTQAGLTRSIYLPSGKHYFKVRPYFTSTGTYGSFTDAWNFTVVYNPANVTGTGIQGIVYEVISGVQTPIEGATVYLYNNTLSRTQITGSNGYYLFTGLANGTTYNLYSAKQGYDTSPILPYTTGINNISTNNILMKIYISPYVPNFVFEKFIVRDLFDRSYLGVTANVYKDDDATASLTGTTDSIGSVVFQLIKDQRYRVTFSGGGLTDTITIYVYAKEESYYVRVLSGFPTGGDRFTDIVTSFNISTVNATHSNISLSYHDTKDTSSIVSFYATNLSTSDMCLMTSASQQFMLNCTVISAGTYQFGFNSTSSHYGFFQQDSVVNFDVGKPNNPMVNTTVDKELMQWSSIILIVLFASLFSYKNVKFGAVLVPLLSLVLWTFGWFEPVANNQAGSLLLLSCATVIGIMIYLRMSEVKVQF